VSGAGVLYRSETGLILLTGALAARLKEALHPHIKGHALFQQTTPRGATQKAALYVGLL